MSSMSLTKSRHYYPIRSMRKYISVTPRSLFFPCSSALFSQANSTQKKYTQCTWKIEYQLLYNAILNIYYTWMFQCCTLSFAQCKDSVTILINTVTNTKSRMYLYYHQVGDVTAGDYPPICLFDCEPNNFNILGRILRQLSQCVDNGTSNTILVYVPNSGGTLTCDHSEITGQE